MRRFWFRTLETQIRWHRRVHSFLTRSTLSSEVRLLYCTIPTNSSCQVTRDAFEEIYNSSKLRTRDGTKNMSLRHQKFPFLVLLSRPTRDFLSPSSDKVGTCDVLEISSLVDNRTPISLSQQIHLHFWDFFIIKKTLLYYRF